jgi:hypothetical protein
MQFCVARAEADASCHFVVRRHLRDGRSAFRYLNAASRVCALNLESEAADQRTDRQDCEMLHRTLFRILPPILQSNRKASEQEYPEQREDQTSFPDGDNRSSSRSGRPAAVGYRAILTVVFALLGPAREAFVAQDGRLPSGLTGLQMGLWRIGRRPLVSANDIKQGTTRNYSNSVRDWLAPRATGERS